MEIRCHVPLTARGVPDYVPRREFFSWGSGCANIPGFYPDYRHAATFQKGSLVLVRTCMVHESYSINSSRKPVFCAIAIWQVPFRESGRGDA